MNLLVKGSILAGSYFRKLPISLTTKNQTEDTQYKYSDHKIDIISTLNSGKRYEYHRLYSKKNYRRITSKN